MFSIRIELNNYFGVELHRNDCCYDSFIHIYRKSHSKLFMRFVDSWNRLIWVNWKIHILISLLFLCCCYYCHCHVNSKIHRQFSTKQRLPLLTSEKNILKKLIHWNNKLKLSHELIVISSDAIELYEIFVIYFELVISDKVIGIRHVINWNYVNQENCEQYWTHTLSLILFHFFLAIWLIIFRFQ